MWHLLLLLLLLACKVHILLSSACCSALFCVSRPQLWRNFNNGIACGLVATMTECQIIYANMQAANILLALQSGIRKTYGNFSSICWLRLWLLIGAPFARAKPLIKCRSSGIMWFAGDVRRTVEHGLQGAGSPTALELWQLINIWHTACTHTRTYSYTNECSILLRAGLSLCLYLPYFKRTFLPKKKSTR